MEDKVMNEIDKIDGLFGEVFLLLQKQYSFTELSDEQQDKILHEISVFEGRVLSILIDSPVEATTCPWCDVNKECGE